MRSCEIAELSLYHPESEAHNDAFRRSNRLERPADAADMQRLGWTAFSINLPQPGLGHQAVLDCIVSKFSAGFHTHLLKNPRPVGADGFVAQR